MGDAGELCDMCGNLIPGNLPFCPHCNEPYEDDEDEDIEEF